MFSRPLSHDTSLRFSGFVGGTGAWNANSHINCGNKIFDPGIQMSAFSVD